MSWGVYKEFALRELKAAGMDPDGQNDDPNTWMAKGTLGLLAVFAEQGHSGSSAPFAIKLFSTLANFEPWGAIHGTDDEWVDVGEASGYPVWQNKRCSHVFKEGDGLAYDIQGRIFRDPDGCCVTNRESRVPVTFPYTPKSIYIDRRADGTWDEPKAPK